MKKKYVYLIALESMQTVEELDRAMEEDRLFYELFTDSRKEAFNDHKKHFPNCPIYRAEGKNNKIISEWKRIK